MLSSHTSLSLTLAFFSLSSSSFSSSSLPSFFFSSFLLLVSLLDFAFANHRINNSGVYIRSGKCRPFCRRRCTQRLNREGVVNLTIVVVVVVALLVFVTGSSPLLSSGYSSIWTCKGQSTLNHGCLCHLHPHPMLCSGLGCERERERERESECVRECDLMARRMEDQQM